MVDFGLLSFWDKLASGDMDGDRSEFEEPRDSKPYKDSSASDNSTLLVVFAAYVASSHRCKHIMNVLKERQGS